MDGSRREVASFRDPSGHIFYYQGEVYRSLDVQAYHALESFLQSPVYSDLLNQGLLIRTEPVDDATQISLAHEEGLVDRLYLKHKRLWLITYPYEWTAGMLLDAARCTLNVQLALLTAGFSLKDASAYNVQFDLGAEGPTPVFIDVGSIEALPNTGGLWIPYKQFMSHFLLPLLYHRKMSLDFKGIFLTDMDGLEPEHAYQMLSPLGRVSLPYLMTITLPHFLRRFEIRRRAVQQVKRFEKPPSEAAREKALFLLRHTARSLKRKVNRLWKSRTSSEWLEYEERNSYPLDAMTEKDAFVRRMCEQVSPETVLDIGCNTGRFSIMAAGLGAKVLAIDSDMTAIEHLYRKAMELRTTVLPLRMDITNPSPGIGWNNRERTTFLDRAGDFDCVFALAVVHHLMIAKGIPLPQIAQLFHRLTNRYLILELVDSTDPMFQVLLQGRENLYGGMSLEMQEQIFARCFSICQSKQLPQMGRVIYLMEKR